MRIRYILLIFFILHGFFQSFGDSIPKAYESPLQWKIGFNINPYYVPANKGFLKGENLLNKKVNSGLSLNIKADFSFNEESQEGLLYKGLYQGIGLGVNSFFANDLLGTPLSIYAFQGAPIVHLKKNLWLGYEWQFGPALGWKHDKVTDSPYSRVVSTSITAMLGIGFGIHYVPSPKWEISAGLQATHFSNGNTSLPNAGVNTLGATLGIAYILNPNTQNLTPTIKLIEEADKGIWLYDITLYGAWRKRVVEIYEEPQLCPGTFGIFGLQFSPLRKLNRFVAIGPSLDLQYDQSAGISSYWVEGTWGSDIKFYKPPFGKQLSIGLSAHAELTMPIFAVNIGIGYDFLSPMGDKPFYQMLTLKTFFTKNIYLNTGYRLANFSDPQNLMLGFGIRL